MRKSELACRLVGFAFALSSATGFAAPVIFRLHAPAARSVFLTGSFAVWKARRALHRGADGTWSVVLDLKPGRYEYAYLVDGRWMLDPGAPILADGLGGRNNVVLVTTAR